MPSVREVIAFFVPSYFTRGRGDIVDVDVHKGTAEVSCAPNQSTALHKLIANLTTIHTTLASGVTAQVGIEPGANDIQPGTDGVQTEVDAQDPNETLNKLLGNLTCNLALDLDIAQPNGDIHPGDAETPFLRYVLSQIGYLDGVDFCEGNNVSFDYKYLIANSPQEIRKALINEIFKGDLDKYWDAFVQKVTQSSRIFYRQLIEVHRKHATHIDTSELISYLTEPKGEYTEDNSSSAREILSREKSKITLLRNGQRLFCETLKALNERQAGEVHPADQALRDILNELRINPTQSNQMIQALFKLHEADEINALEKPNKLMLDLREIESAVGEIAGQVSVMAATDLPEINDCSGSTESEIGETQTCIAEGSVELSTTAEYAPTLPTAEYVPTLPVTGELEVETVLFDVEPNLQPTLDYKITPEVICSQARENTISTVKLILEKEKKRIDLIRQEREAEIKRIRDLAIRKRRRFIKIGSAISAAVLIAGGVVTGVLLNKQGELDELKLKDDVRANITRRIDEEISNLPKINPSDLRTQALENARSELEMNPEADYGRVLELYLEQEPDEKIADNEIKYFRANLLATRNLSSEVKQYIEEYIIDAENNVKGRCRKLGDKLRNLPAEQKFRLSHIFRGLETTSKIKQREIIDDVAEYIRADEIPDDFRDSSFLGNDRYYNLEHITGPARQANKNQYFPPTFGQIIGTGTVLDGKITSLVFKILNTSKDLKLKYPNHSFLGATFQMDISNSLIAARDKVKDRFESDIRAYKEVREDLINKINKLKDELKETKDPSAYSAKVTELVNELESETKKYNAKFRMSSRILVRLHNWIGNEDKPGGVLSEKFKELLEDN